jgi:hypothetical protein
MLSVKPLLLNLPPACQHDRDDDHGAEREDHRERGRQIERHAGHVTMSSRRRRRHHQAGRQSGPRCSSHHWPIRWKSRSKVPRFLAGQAILGVGNATDLPSSSHSLSQPEPLCRRWSRPWICHQGTRRVRTERMTISVSVRVTPWKTAVQRTSAATRMATPAGSQPKSPDPDPDP